MGSIPITCFENEYFIYYARVAQLVEHDLAKVGVAGSSPVSRSLLTKRASDGCPFLLNRVLPDQVVRVSTLRSGRCLTASTGRWLLRSAPVRVEQINLFALV